MDIVNTSYPRGNKFYKVEKEHEAQRFEKLLCKSTYETSKYFLELDLPANDYFSTREVSRWLYSVKSVRDTDKQFPIFKVKSEGLFRAAVPHAGSRVQHLKSNYQGLNRLQVMSGALWRPGMEVQWDPVRKGFIVYDVPYEGELELVKRSGISKAITEVLKDVVAETGMFELLGESLYTDYHYTSSSQLDKDFKEAFESFLEGTHTTEQTQKIALGTGAYTTSYDKYRATYLCQPAQTAGGNYRNDYYKIVRNGKVKPKISTVTRTSLMYKYGGYKLPDNYQDWFDG